MKKDENTSFFLDVVYGYTITPDHYGNPCNCGDKDCPIPKMWEDCYNTWIPLMQPIKSSFFERHCFLMAIICAFILGIIIGLSYEV